MMKPITLVQMLLRHKKYRLVLMSATWLFVCTMCFLHHEAAKVHALTLQEKRSEFMLRELTTIQSQLALFSHDTTHPKQQSMLSTIQSELFALQKSILDLAKASDMQKVSNQIASVKDDVDLKMSDIKQTMVSMKSGKQYLDLHALPFQVMAIDIIAGLPYVSIDYSHHVLPLAVGDTLAGWQVVAAYADAGVAEFMNEKDQFVKVALQN